MDMTMEGVGVMSSNEEKNKSARVNFFKVTARNMDKVNKFIRKLEEIQRYFEKRQYDKMPTLSIDEDKYYIHAMQKREIEEYLEGQRLYYWLLTIARVDFDREIELSNIKKNINERRRPIDHEEDEGLVLDTQIIFDPFRAIIAVYSRRGTISTANLKRFICNLVGERGIMLEVILDKDGYDRLKNFTVIDQLIYRVASPTKFDAYRNETRDEFADLRFAENFKSKELFIVLKPTGNKESLLKKVKNLLSLDKDELKTLKVDGINDGVKDEVDLIKNKLTYRGNIRYKGTLDDQAIYGFLNQSYDEHYEYLRSRFEIYWNRGGIDEEGKIKEK